MDWFNSEKYFATDESVKRQTTDSISENLTDSDLESTACAQNSTIIFPPIYLILHEKKSISQNSTSLVNKAKP